MSNICKAQILYFNPIQQYKNQQFNRYRQYHLRKTLALQLLQQIYTFYNIYKKIAKGTGGNKSINISRGPLYICALPIRSAEKNKPK